MILLKREGFIVIAGRKEKTGSSQQSITNSKHLVFSVFKEISQSI